MSNKKGDRIIQVLLLLIIAGGFGLTAYILGGGSSSKTAAAAGRGPAAMAPAAGNPGKNEQTPAAGIAVEAAAAGFTTVSNAIKLNGDVSSDKSVSIYPDAAGKIVELRVDVGSDVDKGDVIAEIDPSVPGVVYSRSSVNSTISGTVTAVNAQTGDKVSTSSAVIVVGDLKTLEIVTYVPERYSASIRTGLDAEVSLEAYPDIIFDAVVSHIDPVLDAASRTLRIELKLNKQPEGLRPGMFASVKLFSEKSENGLAVPRDALVDSNDSAYVWVINGDSKAEMRNVETGIIGEDLVEITAGLTEGEIVISGGHATLTENASVRIINSGGGAN